MRKRHIYFIKKPIFEFYALKSCLSLTILLEWLGGCRDILYR